MDRMKYNNRVETLAQQFFGSGWADDQRLRAFVAASAGSGGGPEDAPAEPGSADAELSQTSRFRNLFFAAVSHELRTPLNPILALAESLASGIYGDLGERQVEALGHIADNARQLHRLIEDILDISSFEFGEDPQSVFAPTRVDELFRKVGDAFVDRAKAKQISLQVRDDIGHGAHFHSDGRRIEKALSILLDNAIKFTPPGGEITLAASSDPDSGTIRLSVADNGIGIAEADQATLFQAFGQLDRKLARAYNGAGLGLALAKHIADQHGGSIELESAAGQGSKFTLKLPMRAHHAGIAAAD
jgi:signal transduction histidine kinase